MVQDEADRPVLEEGEIEVTPEMVEAGVRALYGCLGDRLPNVFPYARECVGQVYSAMRDIRPTREET